MTIGERIKKRRTALGYSQTWLADRIGITKQQMYKYENGIISNIPSDKIEEIADALFVSPAYLMGWIESESESRSRDPHNANEKAKLSFELLKLVESMSEDDLRDVIDYASYIVAKRKKKKRSE